MPSPHKKNKKKQSKMRVLAVAALAATALAGRVAAQANFTQGSSLGFYQNLTDAEVSQGVVG